MAKKAQKEIQTLENPKLSPQTYWEWRCTINEIDIAKKDFDVNFLKHEMMLKDIEIARLKAALVKTNLNSYQEKVNLCKSEYEVMKKKIEDEIGMSLNDCTIDESFEVKSLKQEG